MSENLIRKEVVRETLEQLGPTFRTKDLSGHPLMLRGHPSLSSERNYHAWVGRFLSAYCSDVKQIPASKHERGAKWQNHRHGACGASKDTADASVALAAGQKSSQSTPGTSAELGPQYAADKAFTARMRLHQSWYRAHVLGVPCGTGPQPHSTSRYGNMLRREDGARGLNFLDQEIREVALERLREGTGTVEPFRLLHNMLSSQPMCFNVFGPLARSTELATRLLGAVPELQLQEVLGVKIEFAPEPPQEYLGDRTAFDAFVDYRRTDGTRALLGIETKLTEPFSAKHYDSPSYRRWMEGPRAPWSPEDAARVSDVRHNQLWRDHLLAIALRDHASSPYQRGTLMLLRHPQDHACARTVEGYRALLKSGDSSFIDMPLDRLVGTWREALSDGTRREWLDDLHQRYLDLAASEGAG